MQSLKCIKAAYNHICTKALLSNFYHFSLSLFVFRENILKTAKALVEDTKNLVSGAASSQEKLAQAAQSSAKTITQLTDVVKLGAASIGQDDPETQVRDSDESDEDRTEVQHRDLAAVSRKSSSWIVRVIIIHLLVGGVDQRSEGCC